MTDVIASTYVWPVGTPKDAVVVNAHRVGVKSGVKFVVDVYVSVICYQKQAE